MIEQLTNWFTVYMIIHVIPRGSDTFVHMFIATWPMFLMVKPHQPAQCQSPWGEYEIHQKPRWEYEITNCRKSSPGRESWLLIYIYIYLFIYLLYIYILLYILYYIYIYYILNNIYTYYTYYIIYIIYIIYILIHVYRIIHPVRHQEET